MEKVFRKFNSFAEAEAADREEYRNMSPLKRLRLLFAIIAAHEGTAAQAENRFKIFVSALNANAVRFLVRGAYGVALHGIPRYTDDLDVVIDSTPDNIERLQRALKRVDQSNPSIPQPLPLNFALTVGQPPLRIDFLTRMDGIEFVDAYAARCVLQLDDAEISYLSKPHLLHNKRFVGRLMDVADAERLEALDRLP